MSNQLNVEEIAPTKTINQIRKDGLDRETLERIASERMELQRVKDETRERLPGQFISLKQDKEQRVFLFTGQYQKIQKQATDFVTKAAIPNRMVTRFRFQIYDLTDPNNPSEIAIWERGVTESEQVLYWLSQGKAELNILRNGVAGSQKTSFTIFPAGR